MKIKGCLLIVAAITMLLLPSCKMPANHPPVIRSLKAEPELVATSGSCQIECIALDGDGDELSYEWLADGGEISGEGTVVSWTAPPEGGKVTVTVTVSDPSGGIAAKSIVFRVETCASCAF